jgi:GTPase Era involved in 16S rRNA processing
MNPETSIREALESTLATAAERLHSVGFPAAIIEGLERLAAQVREPFVLAVVGMVKAGKSSLVNTLLGDDLAKVGATETTATVNWFRYGKPDLERPIRCYRHGSPAPESHPRSFLDRLQGDDEETLRLGSGIDRIEYLVENEWLRRVVLVDTPGLGAVSDEHQERTAEFIRLNTLLRQRHNEETRRLAQEADAILYVQPPPLRSNDRSFLEEFRGMVRHGTSSFNAVAVIGKYDEHDDGDLEMGPCRAKRLTQQLGSAVNTVIPVSAGVHRFVQKLRRSPADRDDLLRFAWETPEEEFSAMTDMHSYYLSSDQCPVAPARRAVLADGIPWASLRATAIYARKNRDRRPTELLDELEKLAGFSELRTLIDRKFILRGPLLRYYRIVQDAEAILENAGYEHVETCRAADAAAKLLEKRFHAVLRRLAPAALPQDRGTVNELAAFVTLHTVQAPTTDSVRAVIHALLPKFAELRRSLESWSNAIESLQTLADHRAVFSAAEFEELHSLFSDNGSDPQTRIGHLSDPMQFIRHRQAYWYERSQCEAHPIRRQVAAKASAWYGSLLHQVAESQNVNASLARTHATE